MPYGEKLAERLQAASASVIHDARTAKGGYRGHGNPIRSVRIDYATDGVAA